MESGNKQPAGTYFVQGHHEQEELVRLTHQDQMTTNAMGGVLPEQPDTSQLERIIDVGCGTGGWLIALAQQTSARELIGVDINPRMITYAREQARAAHVEDRVEFHCHDALLILEFPENYFDLANIRFGSSFLRTWDWPKLLSELLRVVRMEGVVRVTEGEVAPQSTSPALSRLYEMLVCAFYRAGHHFSYGGTGVSSHLASLLAQHGCIQVQTQTHALEFRANTPEGQAFIEDVGRIFRTTRPFLEKRGCASDDYEQIYQQALQEMQQPDFQITWNVHTAWGIKG